MVDSDTTLGQDPETIGEGHMDKSEMIKAMREAWEERTTAARHDYALGAMIRSASHTEDALRALLRFLKQEPIKNPRSTGNSLCRQIIDLVGDRDDLLARSQTALDRRNDFVHGIWLIDPKDTYPFFLGRDLGRPGGVDLHVVSEDEVLELAADFNQLSYELTAWSDSLRLGEDADH